jgi:soluble lytic murein transglycosylase
MAEAYHTKKMCDKQAGGRIGRALTRVRGALMTSALLVMGWWVLSGISGEPLQHELGPQWSCGSAEDCFKSAAMLRDNRGTAERRDQLFVTKLERLRLTMERYPSSLWAKRAGLLLGFMLIEREPADAIRYLRGAQRDFPHLEDYLRLWIGDALVKMNDGAEAVRIYESIREAVPDSILVGRTAYRLGQTFYRLEDCAAATEWLSKALAGTDKDAAAPQALIHLADCQSRAGRYEEARAALKQVWIRFPQTAEAREAFAQLSRNSRGGEGWAPSEDEHYQRAQAFLGLALHAEAIEELRRCLALNPAHPRRHEIRLKLGIAQTRLKLYDQAREVFRTLAAERVVESNEATVWLARIYLRQGLGDKLLELAQLTPASALSREQKAMVHLFTGVWLEDQSRYDDAIAAFHQVAKLGESASQRAEGLWRVGWVQYRIARYSEAVETFKMLADTRIHAFEAQALYWLARASELAANGNAGDYYARVCERHVYSYYCQLASRRAGVEPRPAPEVVSVSSVSEGVSLPESRRPEIERHAAYRRAVELKILGLHQEAARELATLTEQYSRDDEVLLTFSSLLNEVGAYFPALRLAKVHFREKLERGGVGPSSALWTVAYPTGLIPVIRAQGIAQVDPYLAAAIIREESQYDEKAVSIVGAIGLMQLMPLTANQVAQRFGFSDVDRDDLFDQDTNIRLGVRYLAQLLDQFDGNVAYAVAAYNAGPTAVTNWIATHRGREQDEFIELIPYQETRLYVKRVLRSYGEYRRLHPPSQPVS